MNDIQAHRFRWAFFRRSADENLTVATLARAWKGRVHRLATVATAGKFSSAARLTTSIRKQLWRLTESSPWITHKHLVNTNRPP